MGFPRLISVASGEQPADLIITNANIVNVFTGEVETGNVAICRDRIAGIGDYKQATEIFDIAGKYLAPSFINGHTHVESSLLSIRQYALAIIPHGTLAVVTDLHEIANVCGLLGIKYVLNHAQRLPLDLFLMAPSSVPSTHLETSGANIGLSDIRRILRWQNVIGLGEIMSFLDVLSNDTTLHNKINSAQGKVIDGHAPNVIGKRLNGYIAAGIHSDHESVSISEAREKLRKGMHIMIREGSSEKNLGDLLPLVTDKTYKRCMFVTDDRNCIDLLHDGDINAIIRKAIRLGLDPIRAIQLATINPAEYFRLQGIGAIAPGYMANMIVLNNLSDIQPDKVFYRGKLVANGGHALFPVNKVTGKTLANTVNIKPFSIEALKLRAFSETQLVIEVVSGQIITRKRLEIVNIQEGFVLPEINKDILKTVVIERHHATGNIGLGLVKGFGLKNGALASSIAHDSHNIVAIGTNDSDIFTAIKEIERLQGGLVVVCDGKVLASLHLPVAGLLSNEYLHVVINKMIRLQKATATLGSILPSPFDTLSFLSLPVIPELRITDLGLVDVNTHQLVDKQNIS